MKKVLFTFCLVSIFKLNAQEVQSYEMEGNLEANNPLECVCLNEVLPTNNPVDIYIGMDKCIQEGEYQKAAHLFAIAGVYGTYDKLRVEDRTAHQAIIVLQQSLSVNYEEQQVDALFSVLQTELEGGSENLSKICSSILEIGKPNYHPTYMINHGIKAFTEENSDGLLKEYDSEELWLNALDLYLHCGDVEK